VKDPPTGIGEIAARVKVNVTQSERTSFRSSEMSASPPETSRIC